MALEDIKAFRAIGPRLGTAGQPRPEQFEEVVRAGYRLVVNLARPDSPDAVADEPERWAALGMPYLAIPVDFKRPLPEDFLRFGAVLESHRDEPVFVHCAYNWRVSSFVFLHRVLVLGVPRALAHADLAAVWEPDAVWTQFIERMLAAPPAPGGLEVPQGGGAG